MQEIRCDGGWRAPAITLSIFLLLGWKLIRTEGISPSAWAFGEFFSHRGYSQTHDVRHEVSMKIIKQILILVILGLSLGACGDKDSGPFGNTPGPKKPAQM